ncbi:MAG: carboxypeptidase regulatory-like domain-containing protein [Acidobacteriaceae bacterium]|nr:carboxypeptidase regulatory-like domain-containing protein [Acidobacteriaceae bacterium]
MKFRHLRSHTAALIPAILIGFHVHAQTTAGRFSGTVLDPSGARVPQTTVAALNKETGQKVVETTNSSGYFVLYPLLPAVYDITAQKQGFSTFVISDERSMSRNRFPAESHWRSELSIRASPLTPKPRIFSPIRLRFRRPSFGSRLKICPVKPKILLKQTEMAGFTEDDWPHHSERHFKPGRALRAVSQAV